MAFSATPNQKQAIDNDGNLLVAAAAGSGKTAVLVERVIRKLTDPVNPVSADRLLIVTFTNAAAAEMRQRIEKRLYEECRLHPEDAGLRRQKRLIATAQISTIDSFCINLVRENFELVGVEPDFKMADNSTLLMVEREVMSKVVGRYIEEDSDVFRRLLEITGCEYDESKLTDIITELYLYSQQMPFPKAFLQRLEIPYTVSFNSAHPWYKQAFCEAEKIINSMVGDVDSMTDIAPFVVKHTEKLIEYAATASLMVGEIKSCCLKKDWNKFREFLSISSFDCPPNRDKSDVSSLRFADLKDGIKEKLEKLKGLFADSSEELNEKRKDLRPVVELLVKMVEEYTDEFFKTMVDQNILGFHNTEQLALSLLCDYNDGQISVKESAKSLLDRYDEVLVDEFQDVNDLQDTLFCILSNMERNLFVVGDVKQSIYGFRGSNPENFLKKKNRYLPFDTADKDDARKIILSDNFRSRAGVCEYVNFFFSQIMQGQVGSLVYDSDERLNPAARYPESDSPAAELLITDCTDLGLSADDRFAAETSSIADYIISVMNEGRVIRQDENTLRDARYGDFTILLRSMKRASVLARELAIRGIPVDYSAESFSESVEISTFLSLLKVIDNPESDVELLCVLMSPIFAFTAQQIADIRAEKRNGSLFSALVFAAKSGNVCAQAFINKLSFMRRNAATLSVDRLIMNLLYETDYLSIASAMSGGSARRANLLTLAEMASGYCSAGQGSISGFLRYMKLVNDKDIKTADTSGGDSVKIMTMHKSKGLQFPVCIVADLASPINDEDARDSIIYDDDLGIAFRYYDHENDVKIDTLPRKLLSRKTHIVNIEEQLRLFYVALTRAENRVVTCVCVSDLEKKLESLATSLDGETPHITAQWLSGGASIGDWVLISSLLHPDGMVLRDRTEMRVPTVGDQSHLKISIIKPKFEKAEESREEEYNPDTELSDKIRANIDYTYPYEALRDIAAKSSVSALVGSANDRQYDFTARPAFMEKQGATSANRGTAVHRVMQYISLDGVPDVDSEIERLVEWQYISETDAQLVDKSVIERFFASDVFSRVMRSVDVRREMRFLTEMSAVQLDPKLLNKGVSADETVVVQGAVDLCFDEGDGIVVLDFKTDRTDSPERLRDTYAPQLEIYAKACEKLFGKPVKEKIIYSFFMGKEIKI